MLTPTRKSQVLEDAAGPIVTGSTVGVASDSVRRRAAVALCVCGVHILVLAVLLQRPVGQIPGLPDATIQSIEVSFYSEVLPPSSPDLPAPRLIAVRFEPPDPARFGVLEPTDVGPDNTPAPTEPASPPSEMLIAEAQPQDAEPLRRFCEQSLPPQIRGKDQGTVVLLVRIEADGHVSDMLLEESSGSERLDRVTQACVISGLFEPRRDGFRTVASWQRIHWSWAPVT